MEMKWKRFVSIPVICVFDLMGFVYFVTMFILMEEWLGLTAGFLHASFFTLLAFLSVFCFISCVLTDPGPVPSDYQPDVEQRQPSAPTSSVQHFRKCDKCRTYRPPRAHHCRVCKKCILRMDHHCLWINNCVGYWNYKSFVILLLNATLACVYSSVVVISCALQENLDFTGRTPFKIFYMTYGALVVGLSITVGALLGWHIFLITRNMTTIEHHESTRAMWLARKSGQTYRHPFNLSFHKNVELILGPNMLKWLCPTAVSHLKDGTSYPTTRDS